MNEFRDLNLEERKKIESFLKQGFSCRSISKNLQRAKNTIIVEVRRNGGKLNYNAQLAQIEATRRRETQYVKLSERNKLFSINPYSTLEKRISNLEMQTEILYDIIKEMKQ